MTQTLPEANLFCAEIQSCYKSLFRKNTLVAFTLSLEGPYRRFETDPGQEYIEVFVYPDGGADALIGNWKTRTHSGFVSGKDPALALSAAARKYRARLKERNG